MPSNGTRKAKAAKAKAVEVSDGSENGVREDNVVQPPNLTADEISELLKKLLELTLQNETSSRCNLDELATSEKKLKDLKKLTISNATTLSDNIKNKMSALKIHQLSIKVSALSVTKKTLEEEVQKLSEAVEKVNQQNLINQQQPCQQQPETSNVIDIFDKIRREVTAEKVAAEKVAAEKVAAEKVAADKAVADKAVADKVAIEKATANKAVADKAVADKVAAAKAAAEPNTMVEFTVSGDPGIWKRDKCVNTKPHDGKTCRFRHPQDCISFCSEQDYWTCKNPACVKDHIQPLKPQCKYGKKCNRENCGFNH